MILVLNSGSSTVKYRLVDPGDPAAGRGGMVERIGEPGGVADHTAAVREILDGLRSGSGPIVAVGHRVVHGGSRFVRPTRLDDDTVAAIEELTPLAPLHNPGALAGIEAARRVLGSVPHVAVFDTAFHAALPAPAATYALDAEVAARHGIRRYGFHGISHEYVAGRTAALLGRPLAALNVIVLHLGNGASATAVRGGRSVETSMGFTPLEGLVMGTRTGDLDPAVPGFLQRAGLASAQVEELLQRRSGLAGLCGANDMRTVLARRAAGDAAATLAFDVYCHRIRKYVGAYHAVLGRLDAVVFTAGVGEHAVAVRAATLDDLDSWGIVVDPDRNAGGSGERLISPDGARVAVCVVPTNEELAIARAAAELLS
jgi:acetate kinase